MPRYLPSGLARIQLFTDVGEGNRFTGGFFSCRAKLKFRPEDLQLLAGLALQLVHRVCWDLVLVGIKRHGFGFTSSRNESRGESHPG